MSQLKAARGAQDEVVWYAPAPVSEVYSLAIARPDGVSWASPADLTFAVQRPAVSVSGIGADRRTLTLAASASAPLGVARDAIGAAWLVTPSDGVFAVEVARLNATTVVLAHPLPAGAEASGGAPASLQWARYSATIAGANVTAVSDRGYTWAVYYAPLESLGVAGTQKVDRGTLAVVEIPFRVGATTADLLAADGRLRAVPSAQGSHAAQLAAAERELVLLLRAELSESGLYEDDLAAGDYRDVVALLAAERLLLASEPALADRYRARALELMHAALRRAWADADRTGLPGPGKVGTQVTGARTALFAGGLDPAGDALFSRRGAH